MTLPTEYPDSRIEYLREPTDAEKATRTRQRFLLAAFAFAVAVYGTLMHVTHKAVPQAAYDATHHEIERD